jgi:hypothetical protein
MSYAFRSVGAVAEGTGALSPGAPAGVVVGDLLLLSLVSRDNSQTLSAPNPPTGWTLVSPTSPVGWNYLFARIADGTASDTPTGLDYTGGPHAQAQIAAFSGGGFSLASIVTNSVSQNLPGSQVSILYSAGLTITPANCLVIAVGTKNKTSTSDGTTINALTGFTKIDSNVNAGTDISQWWGYQIQTTATNIAASLTQTLTGTTETLQYTSLLVALQSSLDLPATTGTYSYTGGSATFSTSSNPNQVLLASGGTYNYQLAPESSDFGLEGGFATYLYTGGVAFLVPTISPVSLVASAGTYSLSYQTAQLTFFVLPPPPPTPNTNIRIWTADSIVLNASGSPGHWHNTQEEPYYQWTADGNWDANGVLSRYGLSHGVPPQLGKNVTSRTFSWNEMARRAWGSEFSAPDHAIYRWSNGRSFDSTDMGETGIYEKANEDH